MSFAVVGVLSNAATYALYLTLTDFGVGHKSAMTLVFGTTVATTYALNRRVTFGHRGPVAQSMRRYLLVYTLAYIGNLAALAVLVDALDLPHRLVTLSLIIATACLMFLLQKRWVFSPRL